MRRPFTRLLAGFAIFALVAAIAAPALAGTRADSPRPNLAPATGVIVQFEPGSARSVRAELARRGLRVQRAMYRDSGVIVDVPAAADAASLTESLAGVPGVRIAAENRAVVHPLWAPNDPGFKLQWAYPKIQATSAWDVTRGGSFVSVAVIDTGVDVTHPDLVGNLDLANGYDVVHGDAIPEDEFGHGSHVTGIVAATTNNGIGVAGTAPGVRVVPIKVMQYSSGTTGDLVDGLRRAGDLGVEVINISLGAGASELSSREITVMQDAVDYALSRGCVIVSATGNDATNPAYDPATGVLYPAACAGVIAVGATNQFNQSPTYSNWGDRVDIVAPGGDSSLGIRSTYRLQSYMTLNGTSMASPFVAGAAALLRSRMPAATAAEVKAALLSTAKDLGPVGWDQHYGSGLLQMRAALDAIAAIETPSPDVFRVQGADRYATALAISRSAFASATVAVVASGEDFPDALSASALAGAYDAPLLLTRKSSLPAGLVTELRRLGVAKVVIIGGRSAVGASVVTELGTAGFTVERTAGTDRYATSVAVANEVRRISGTSSPNVVFVARGDLFADALAVAPIAAARGIPVLLTPPTTLPAAISDAISSLGVTETIVLGSSSAVGQAVAQSLADVPGVASVARWQGIDRYETSVQIARNGVLRGWATGAYFGVATGVNFPDALAGGAAVGAKNGILLLTRPDTLPTGSIGVLRDLGYSRVPVAILGSAATVGTNVEGQLRQIRY